MKRPISSKLRAQEFHRNRGTPKPSDLDAADKSKSGRRKYLRQYVRWLYPYRWAILGVLLLALLTAALDMVWPLAIKRIIDMLAGTGDMGEKLGRLTRSVQRELAARHRARDRQQRGRPPPRESECRQISGGPGGDRPDLREEPGELRVRRRDRFAEPDAQAPGDRPGGRHADLLSKHRAGRHLERFEGPRHPQPGSGAHVAPESGLRSASALDGMWLAFQ